MSYLDILPTIKGCLPIHPLLRVPINEFTQIQRTTFIPKLPTPFLSLSSSITFTTMLCKIGATE